MVCAYLTILLTVAIVIASFMQPWTYQWSAYTLNDPIRLTLPPAALLYAPILALGWQVLLLSGAWFMLGLTVLVGSLAFKDEKWGFGVGMLLNLGSVIAWHIEFPAPLSLLPLNYHMILGTHAFGDLQSGYPSLTLSYLYWITWIAALLLVGWWLSMRHDFLRKG